MYRRGKAPEPPNLRVEREVELLSNPKGWETVEGGVIWSPPFH